MFSTFSSETNKQTNIISLQIEKNISVSTPISIPKKSTNENTTEYELNLNFFNPSKMSPPDCWKTRLEQRMKSLYGSNLSNKE